MAKKKAAPNKHRTNKTMIKIAEAIGEVAGEISVKKDQFKEMASHVIDSVKEGIDGLTAQKKSAAQKKPGSTKKAGKKVVKKAAKVVKKAALPKKAAAAKKAIKKAAKKISKKATKIASKSKR